MSLFHAQDIIKNRGEKTSASSIHHLSEQVSFWDKTQRKIEDVINCDVIKEGASIHFWSNGDWNMHDLLYYFLKFCGPSKVYITSWAISEIAMRKLYEFTKDGLITELNALFDYRNTTRKPAELEFIKKNAHNVKLAKCHAKVTVLENLKFGISIVSSANYTRNPRLEAGVITVSKRIAEFNAKCILNEINDESK